MSLKIYSAGVGPSGPAKNLAIRKWRKFKRVFAKQKWEDDISMEAMLAMSSRPIDLYRDTNKLDRGIQFFTMKKEYYLMCKT